MPDMPSVPLAIFCVFLPQRFKRLLYTRVFGWEVHPTARIGYSLLHGKHFKLGEGSYIGHGNIIKGIGRFELAERAYVKNLNNFFAQALPQFPVRSFYLGPRSLIMSRHFFDVAGEITIGSDCTIGGRDSQFWSHSRFTTADGTKALEPRTLFVGDRVYVGARATLVHCFIPTDCVVGAGAVPTKQFVETGQMIVGNPALARPIKIS